MCSLLHYFAGGLAVLLAMDYVAPPGGTGVNVLRQSAVDVAAASATNVVDRVHKGDRLAVASPAENQDRTVATVEVIGLRDAAVVYRARDGRVLFQTDPVENATVVAKGVTLPQVTIRDTSQTPVRTVSPAVETTPLAPPDAATGREQKIPEGCDPAFSPLAASAHANNFSTRCLASNAPTTMVAAAFL
jgi:hypothetical protein